VQKPYIVGIAGGTCSGKSTAADRLAARFNAYQQIVINIDNYYKHPGITSIAPITGVEYVEHNHPDAIDLDKLYADFHTACTGSADIVFVEGLFALYLPEIREKLDLKLFVDLESDARLVRRIKRFTSFGESFDGITDRYIDTVRFRHDEFVEPTRWHADIVLNGTLDDNKGLDIVECYIRKQLEK